MINLKQKYDREDIRYKSDKNVLYFSNKNNKTPKKTTTKIR